MKLDLAGIYRNAIYPAIAVGVVALSVAHAQEEDLESWELSPFSVSADEDVGYFATNTMAGTRINTELRDTPATISVLTEEFLQDLNVSQLSDAVHFMSNTQADWSEDGEQGNRLTSNHTNYRVRGINASLARNYFVWTLPTDTYNVQRIDQSRGPNSILFGVGSPGGIINTSTKQANPMRSTRQVGATVGSYDLYRATVDLNQVLSENKAALRFNAVYEEKGSHRLFTDREFKAAHLAGMWRVLPGTVIRIEGEIGEIEEVAARPWTLQDSVTVWEAAGSTILGDQTGANPQLGIGRHALASPRLTFVENSNQLVNMEGTNFSNRPQPTPANQYVLTDTSRADFSVNPGGPGGRRYTEFNTITAAIEQRITRDTYVEFSYNRQHGEMISHDPGWSTHVLWADPNGMLNPTYYPGVTNDYAGDYYLETNWYRRVSDNTTDTMRLTGSTEFDFDKWGHYRIAVMGEREEKDNFSYENQEIWEGLPFRPEGQEPEQFINNNWNMVYRRTYVTPGDWSTYRVTGGDGELISGMVDPVTGQALNSTWGQVNVSIHDDPTTLESAMAVLEARYFRDRLILLGGTRRDNMTIVDRGTKFDNQRLGYVIDYDNAAVDKLSFDTHTFGAVGHVLPWLSLHYNRSTNSNIPNLSHRLLPDDQAPTGSTGTGEDFGLTLSLMENKVFFRAIYYETASENETGFGASLWTISGWAGGTQIINGLANSGQITPEDANSRRRTANANTFDRTADGYEFELVANPTPNWRISAGYTRSNVIEDNVAAEAIPWVENLVTWARQYDTSVPTPAQPSVEAAIDNLYDLLETAIGTSGLASVGNRRDKWSLVTRYGIREGALKNAFVGGSFIYQSGAVAGRSSNEVLYGNSLRMVGLFAGYRWQLENDRSLNLQVNLDNAFDFDDPQITAVSANGDIRRFRVIEPRRLRVTATLAF